MARRRPASAAPTPHLGQMKVCGGARMTDLQRDITRCCVRRWQRAGVSSAASVATLVAAPGLLHNVLC